MTDAAVQSGPVHVVLQPNLDDADTIDDLYYPPGENDRPHLQFLRDNPDGFLRVARLHPRGHKVVLVQSRGANPQLYINKQCRDFDYSDPPNDAVAREVRICTLQGPEVYCTLPTGRQFAETLAYQRLEREDGPDYLSGLYLRYYNGGGIDSIAERYRLANQTVPEAFIWHVLEQLTHGLRYLFLGLEPGSLVTTAETYENDDDDDWDPIFLRDMTPSNIFTHFPSQAEKDAGNNFDDSFPQVVMGDFGVVITGDDIERNPTFPDWSQCTAYGLRELGVALRILFFARGHDEPLNGAEIPIWPGRSVEELRGRGIYTDQLIDILKKWDRMIEVYGEEASEYTEVSTEGISWPQGWPDNEWLFDEVLPVASAKVAQLRRDGNAAAILRAGVIDLDTQAPTDLTPRVFENAAAATAAMNNYDLNWTMVPARGEGNENADGLGPIRINLRVSIIDQ